MLLAVGGMWGLGLGDILMLIVVIAAAIAVTLVALKEFQITVPPWLVRIIVIVAVAIVAIIAIRLILSA